MIAWLLDWLKVRIGRWLLREELEQERQRDLEKWRRQREIIDANYTTDETADDLDADRF